MSPYISLSPRHVHVSLDGLGPAAAWFSAVAALLAAAGAPLLGLGLGFGWGFGWGFGLGFGFGFGFGLGLALGLGLGLA